MNSVPCDNDAQIDKITLTHLKKSEKKSTFSHIKFAMNVYSYLYIYIYIVTLFGLRNLYTWILIDPKFCEHLKL